MNSVKKSKPQNDENQCPIARKRCKQEIAKTSTAAEDDTTSSVSVAAVLEEMGVGMLESDESSCSGSAIVLAVSGSEENSNEATPNLDAPKFCHPLDNCLNVSVESDATDNASFVDPNDTLKSHSYKVNNNNTIDMYAQSRKIGILQTTSAAQAQKSRSPLAAVSYNTNYAQQGSSSSGSGSIASTSAPSRLGTVDASAVKKQIFAPDENFFLYRDRLQRPNSVRDNFARLSDEVILQIFKWIPKKTLIRCSMVSHRFSQLAQDESLWTRLDFGGRCLRMGALGEILSRGVVILRLAQSELAHPVFDPEFFTLYPTFQTKLQFLDLSMCVITKPSLKMLLSRCRNLKKLSLEHVKIGDDICDEVARNINLEALNLTMCEGLEAWSIRKLMGELKNLNSLNVSWTWLDVDAVNAVVSNVTPNLLRLNIAGCRKTMFDSHLHALAKRCTQLLELDLSDCTGLTSESIGIISKFKSLEYLSLSRCYGISAATYMELAKLPSLAYLDVFGILSDNALEILEHTFPALGINKFIHSSVARPTVGSRRTSIWGLRTRD